MKKYTYTEKKDTRSGFGAGLLELGKNNPNVVALCAERIARGVIGPPRVAPVLSNGTQWDPY